MNDRTVIFRGDDKTAEQVADVRRTWASFFAEPYVLHWRGETYVETRCPESCDKRGTPNWRYCAHLVPHAREHRGPNETDHADGICFVCTGVVPPDGWSAEERRAVEATSGDPFALLRGTRRGNDGVDKGARRRIRATHAAERLQDGRV